MKRITTRDEFIQFADERGLRDDWHEPDEQDLTAVVRGVSFDNAGFWGSTDVAPNWVEREELHVVFYRTQWPNGASEPVSLDPPLAAVNLATLCAWATGHEVPGPGEITTNEFQRTEAYWRSTLANEVRDYAEELEAEVTTKSIGVALSALVKQAADRIGQMSRTDRPNRWEMLNDILRQAGLEYPLGLSGVRDLVTQRDGNLAALHETQADVRALTAEVERLKRELRDRDEPLDPQGR